MSTKVTKIEKRGRPVTIAWSKANLLWKNKNDRELAAFLECTPARVSQKRNALIAGETAKGNEGKPEKYVSRRRYARAV